MTGRAGSMIRDGALWGGASVLVLALHLGGALWLMHRAEAGAPPPGLPEPVFVDLAPAEEPAEEAIAPVEEAADEPEEVAEEPVQPEPQPEPEPEPEQVAEPLDLPPLPELEPLDDMAELFPPAPPELETPPAVALSSSARPERRPEREPEPVRQAEPRREQRREPERQRQAEPRRQEQPAPQQQARRADQGAGGTGAAGPSPQQKASLMSQWGGQIRSCISRRASAPRGIREGGRVTLRLSVSRSGSIQGVGVAGSSGIAALDQAAVQAAQRAGRCPRAPSELTDASYAFDLPINLQVR